MTIKHAQGVQASKVVRSRVKSYTCTGLNRPLGFQQAEDPRFPANRHMKVVRLSALRIGRFYPPGSTSGTNFC
jgi:hypothetical protein